MMSHQREREYKKWNTLGDKRRKGVKKLENWGDVIYGGKSINVSAFLEIKQLSR